jgi:hypothetical protein
MMVDTCESPLPLVSRIVRKPQLIAMCESPRRVRRRVLLQRSCLVDRARVSCRQIDAHGEVKLFVRTVRDK